MVAKCQRTDIGRPKKNVDGRQECDLRAQLAPGIKNLTAPIRSICLLMPAPEPVSPELDFAARGKKVTWCIGKSR